MNGNHCALSRDWICLMHSRATFVRQMTKFDQPFRYKKMVRLGHKKQVELLRYSWCSDSTGISGNLYDENQEPHHYFTLPNSIQQYHKVLYSWSLLLFKCLQKTYYYARVGHAEESEEKFQSGETRKLREKPIHRQFHGSVLRRKTRKLVNVQRKVLPSHIWGTILEHKSPSIASWSGCVTTTRCKIAVIFRDKMRAKN